MSVGEPLGFGDLIAPRPSIDWALARITGVWAKSGEMIKCPLKGHDDSTPSFNLWADDEEGVPQRFGCFGCGRNGDVVEMIQELEGVDRRTALLRATELAQEEAQDDTPRDRAPREQEKRELEPTLQELKDQVNATRLASFQAYMTEKGMGWEDLERFAMEKWEWTPGERGVVAVPHRRAGGELTGLKYRTTSRKWNEPGSRFPALYGTWLDQNHPNVLLCEGESDTVWGAWSLREDDWDVMGLPSGINQQAQDEWLERLADRTVVIVFDADVEGMKGALRWSKILPNALFIRLPEDEDLLSCGIPVKELIQRAAVPLRWSGMVDVVDGLFVKHTTNGDVPVADFSFEPVRELITEEGPAWEGMISGRRDVALLRASDLHTGTAITKWANRQGRSWTGGSGPSVQGVFNYLASHSAFLPLERATTRAGKIGRSFVGPDFCIGPDRVRYIPPQLADAHLETKLKIRKGEWDSMSLRALEALNDPAMMATILGWLCATLIRGQRAPAPPLFVSGESGAGKTHLIQTVLSAFGFEIESNLTTTTPFGVDSMIGSCVGFPVWFDEYRGGARADSMERLRQLLRDAYNGQVSTKGGMKQNATELTEVPTWAGILVSGEMGNYETSLRDRCVMLDLDPDSRNREAREFLRDRRRTTGLGYALLEFLARRPDSLFQVKPMGDDEWPDRFRETLGFVQAGWDAWKAFRWESGLHDRPPGEPGFEGMGKDRQQTEDPWMVAIRACVGVVDKNGNHIVSEDGGVVTLIPNEIVVEAKRVGIELPARSNEMVSWLKRRYQVDDVRLVGGRRAKRVTGLDL